MTATEDDGDTLEMRYAERITIVRHTDYTVVSLADPWNDGKTLHTYILIADNAAQELTEPRSSDEGSGNFKNATVIHVPLKRAVIATSVHCGLLESLGREAALGGVCDRQFINLPWMQAACDAGRVADCGTALSPTIEKIIDLGANAILLSPFQNSGGYGKLEELEIPIVETADYMETSPLGRAEWMRFYGMLFGAEAKADSLFAEVERNYYALKAQAAQATTRPTVMMDKQTGSVWYVPGGQSTIGRLIADANLDYPWADDTHSGSLALPFERVLERAASADYWLFRYNGGPDYSRSTLLSENAGYDQFAAFRHGETYGCNTATSTFYEDTPFHPDRLLRDFIAIGHPELGMQPRYFRPIP